MTFTEFAQEQNLGMVYVPDGKLVIDGKTPFKYKVTIRCGNEFSTFSFTYGPGHVVYKNSGKNVPYSQIKEEIRKIRDQESFFNRIKPKNPSLTDILPCLRSDYSCIESAPLFKDFCAEFGYSDDSISAKKMHDEMIEAYFKIKKLFGKEIKKFMDCEE